MPGRAIAIVEKKKTHRVGLSRGFLLLLLLLPPECPRTAAQECTLERASSWVVLEVCRHVVHPTMLPWAEERKIVASMAAKRGGVCWPR